LTIK
jgi:hypothetical protein